MIAYSPSSYLTQKLLLHSPLFTLSKHVATLICALAFFLWCSTRATSAKWLKAGKAVSPFRPEMAASGRKSQIGTLNLELVAGMGNKYCVRIESWFPWTGNSNKWSKISINTVFFNVQKNSRALTFSKKETTMSWYALWRVWQNLLEEMTSSVFWGKILISPPSLSPLIISLRHWKKRVPRKSCQVVEINHSASKFRQDPRCPVTSEGFLSFRVPRNIGT